MLQKSWRQNLVTEKIQTNQLKPEIAAMKNNKVVAQVELHSVLYDNINQIYVFQSRLHLYCLPNKCYPVSFSEAFIRQIKKNIQPLISLDSLERQEKRFKSDKMIVAFRGHLSVQVLYEWIVWGTTAAVSFFSYVPVRCLYCWLKAASNISKVYLWQCRWLSAWCNCNEYCSILHFFKEGNSKVHFAEDTKKPDQPLQSLNLPTVNYFTQGPLPLPKCE